MNITPVQLSTINVGLSQFLAKELTRKQEQAEESKELEHPDDEETKTTASSVAAAASSSLKRTTKSKSKSKSHAKSRSTRAIKRMEGVDEPSMHGHLGAGQNWNAPIIAHESDKVARPGYQSFKAHEYQDDEVVLRQKIKVLASLLRSSKHCVAYTGAGISTASGINDYASKGKSSMATGNGAAAYRPKKKKGLNAEPTFAHYCLAALHRENMLQSWVQQNHDGLPQKAKFPQARINEIHGAWFDPSNPVVPMDGTLRDDLHYRMIQDKEKADLVLTMGTSLCGMNADSMVSTASTKFCTEGRGLGSVIIGFQRTPLDQMCSLRIFGRIDEVMCLLAIEMELQLDIDPYSFTGSGCKNHVYQMPYDKNGQKLEEAGAPTMRLNLQRGAKLRLTAGPGKGYEGTVARTPNMNGGQEYAYTVNFPCTRENSPAQGKATYSYALGGWMLEAAARGELHLLPVVNA
jgi:NAD-dependent SIR2 family protein deacetylase